MSGDGDNSFEQIDIKKVIYIYRKYKNHEKREVLTKEEKSLLDAFYAISEFITIEQFLIRKNNETTIHYEVGENETISSISTKFEIQPENFLKLQIMKKKSPTFEKGQEVVEIIEINIPEWKKRVDEIQRELIELDLEGKKIIQNLYIQNLDIKKIEQLTNKKKKILDKTKQLKKEKEKLLERLKKYENKSFEEILEIEKLNLKKISREYGISIRKYLKTFIIGKENNNRLKNLNPEENIILIPKKTVLSAPKKRSVLTHKGKYREQYEILNKNEFEYILSPQSLNQPLVGKCDIRGYRRPQDNESVIYCGYNDYFDFIEELYNSIRFIDKKDNGDMFYQIIDSAKRVNLAYPTGNIYSSEEKHRLNIESPDLPDIVYIIDKIRDTFSHISSDKLSKFGFKNNDYSKVYIYQDREYKLFCCIDINSLKRFILNVKRDCLYDIKAENNIKLNGEEDKKKLGKKIIQEIEMIELLHDTQEYRDTILYTYLTFLPLRESIKNGFLEDLDFIFSDFETIDNNRAIELSVMYNLRTRQGELKSLLSQINSVLNEIQKIYRDSLFSFENDNELIILLKTIFAHEENKTEFENNELIQSIRKITSNILHDTGNSRFHLRLLNQENNVIFQMSNKLKNANIIDGKSTEELFKIYGAHASFDRLCDNINFPVNIIEVMKKIVKKYDMDYPLCSDDYIYIKTSMIKWFKHILFVLGCCEEVIYKANESNILDNLEICKNQLNDIAKVFLSSIDTVQIQKNKSRQ